MKKVATFELAISGQGADGQPLTPQGIARILTQVVHDLDERYSATQSGVIAAGRTTLGHWEYRADVEVPE